MLCKENTQEMLNFRHFSDVTTFSGNDQKGHKKSLNHSIGVSAAVDMVCRNMKDTGEDGQQSEEN